MNVPKELPTYLNNWIKYDDYIKQINQKTKKLKEKKDELETKITYIIENNNLTESKFNLGTNRIGYNEINSTCSLSYKFILECLTKYYGDIGKAEEICNFIKVEREKTKKISYCIKRQTNKS